MLYCSRRFRGLLIRFTQKLKHTQPQIKFEVIKFEVFNFLIAFQNPSLKPYPHGYQSKEHIGENVDCESKDGVKQDEPICQQKVTIKKEPKPIDSKKLPHSRHLGSRSGKALIDANMNFCLTCGDMFGEISELSVHVQENVKCNTKANLQYLSKYGFDQFSKQIGQIKKEPMNSSEMIFCQKCGTEFCLIEELYSHVEKNVDCESKENLEFLAKFGVKQDEPECEQNVTIKKEPLDSKKLPIFCQNCGAMFYAIEELYSHVEENVNCETTENLQFLAMSEIKQEKASPTRGK